MHKRPLITVWWFVLLASVSLLAFPAEEIQIRPKTLEGVVNLPERGPKATSTASIEGVVVSELDGAPLPGATVTLSLASKYLRVVDISSDQPEIAKTTTDARGRFLFRGIDAGEYDWTVKLDEYVTGRSTDRISLGSDQRLNNLVVRLARSGRIGGRVRGESGQPVVGIPVELFKSQNQGFLSVVRVMSAPDGSYRLEDFPIGQYFVAAGVPMASGTGSAVTLVNATAVSRTLDLTLDATDTYRIRGKAVDSGSGSAPERLVWWIGAKPYAVETDGERSTAMQVSYDSRSGVFETPALLPGIYRIRVQDRANLNACGIADVVLSRSDVGGVVVTLSANSRCIR